jgi:hypothetical protein
VTTPGLFRFPIRSADIWGLNDGEKRSDEDIAADLDYQDNAVEQFLGDATSASNVPTFGQSFDRSNTPATFLSASSYSSSDTFSFTFAASPRVVLTVECGRGQNIAPILTAVRNTGFDYTLWNAAVSTTTCVVHWVAVEAE